METNSNNSETELNLVSRPKLKTIRQYQFKYENRNAHAIIDVEALITRKIIIIEQIGIVVVSEDASIVYEEHHIIVKQPLTIEQLETRFDIPKQQLYHAIYGYNLVTGDNYIHNVGMSWRSAKAIVIKIIKQYNAIAWAKGADLERKIFEKDLVIYDLADFGCPKYPWKIHNPLNECRYFAQFIPKINSFFNTNE
jgi:hypothetical protein